MVMPSKELTHWRAAAPFLLLRGLMNIRSIFRRPASLTRRGFTMVEMGLTLTIIAIMAAVMVPKIGRVMQATRVNRTSAIIAADVEQAFTLAARYRRPMRLSCTCGTGTYTVADVS